MPDHIEMLMPVTVINDKRGFSLTELLTVIAIISILSGVVVISIKSKLPQYYLSGAARQVMTDLMLARMQAVSKNTNTTVTFTSTGYTIVVVGVSTVTTNIPSQYNGVSLSTAGITFTPMGTTLGLATTTITLTGSMGLAPKYVDVSVAGRARIR